MYIPKESIGQNMLVINNLEKINSFDLKNSELNIDDEMAIKIY
jgi:hypothetical protein